MNHLIHRIKPNVISVGRKTATAQKWIFFTRVCRFWKKGNGVKHWYLCSMFQAVCFKVWGGDLCWKALLWTNRPMVNMDLDISAKEAKAITFYSKHHWQGDALIISNTSPVGAMWQRMDPIPYGDASHLRMMGFHNRSVPKMISLW